MQKCRHEYSVGVNLVIDFFYVATDSYRIGRLIMKILHFKDMGDTECRFLAANTVVLALGEYQISIATYFRG